MVVSIILIILGFYMLIKGADLLVDGASKLAIKIGVPEIIVGLTIVAVGTSMPELMVSVTSSIDGHSDIAIGNVIGSNLVNLFFILGVCSIIAPITVSKQTKYVDNLVTVFSSIILYYFCINDGYPKVIDKTEGIILLICCMLFIIYNVYMAKKTRNNLNECREDIKKISNLKIAVNIIAGTFLLKFGADIVIKHSVNIASIMGISEKLISLTIVAFSTSLPELITSVTATTRGSSDMAIGNVIGSQIFNIFLIIGIASFLAPINYTIEYNKDMILLVIGTIAFSIFPYIKNKNNMNKIEGIMFTSIYVMYIVNLIYTNI